MDRSRAVGGVGRGTGRARRTRRRAGRGARPRSGRVCSSPELHRDASLADADVVGHPMWARRRSTNTARGRVSPGPPRCSEPTPAFDGPARSGSCGSLGVPIDGNGPSPGRPPAIVVPGGWRPEPRGGLRLTPQAHVPTMMGRATPSLWSPFLRVGARTLRTEQCAKSQCVYPVEHGRCGSPCLSARRSYGNCNTGRPIRVCCSGRPTFQQRTRNRPHRTRWASGPTVLLRRV